MNSPIRSCEGLLSLLLLIPSVMIFERCSMVPVSTFFRELKCSVCCSNAFLYLLGITTRVLGVVFFDSFYNLEGMKKLRQSYILKAFFNEVKERARSWGSGNHTCAKSIVLFKIRMSLRIHWHRYKSCFLNPRTTTVGKDHCKLLTICAFPWLWCKNKNVATTLARQIYLW